MATAFQAANYNQTNGGTGLDTELLEARRHVLAHLIELDLALGVGCWTQAEPALQRFCAYLIDYAALSAYRVMDRRDAPQHMREAIASTTRDLMRFHDRFSRGTGNVRQARPQLESLALVLETRFELEDDLAPETLIA